MDAGFTRPVARITGVSHRYGATTALGNVSLELPSGRMIGLIGPDGAGKSTLLGLIAGARKLQAGSVDVFDGSMGSAGHRRAVCTRIAYMPQGLGKNLYQEISVAENLSFFGTLFGLSASEREARIRKLTAATRLLPFLDRPAGKLSGGMKQKLGLCCALIHDPDLLILDEPTTGVDPLSRRQFWELIANLRRERPSMTVLVSTAYIDEAAHCDWLVAMDHGHVLASATIEELRSKTGAQDLDAVFIALQHGGTSTHEQLVIPPRQASTQAPVIVAKDLTARFGTFTAVDRVSFAIERGEIFGFLGSNGCGKTTTMKMLTGLLPVNAGEAWLFSRPVDPHDLDTRRRVGYMSQGFSLYSELTVRQNLVLHARLFAIPRETIPERVEQMGGRFGLMDEMDALPDDLPLGVRQRLSLAVAMVHKPEMLILDEPTSGVDPVARDYFWQTLIDLSRRDMVTIFISTHFMNEAERCDRISLMHAGQVLVSDTPAAIIESIGAANLEEAFVRYLESASIGESEKPPPTSQADWTAENPHERSAVTKGLSGFFNLRRLFGYSIRESLELRRDPIRLALALAGSAILMLVMGYGITMDVEDLRFAVLDRDQTATSRDYALNLAGSRYFIEEPPLADYADIDYRMRAGKISLALEIPPEFGRDIARRSPVTIGAWIDGAMPSRAETVEGYVQGIHAHWLATRGAQLTGAPLPAPPIKIETRFRYNPDVKSIVAMVPAVIPVLLILIPAILTALSVVREKELGSIINMYVTPVTRLEFLLGKQLPYVGLAMVNFFMLAAMAVMIFGVPLKGSFLTLTAGAFLYVISATAIGMVISTFTRSQIAALFGTAVLTILPAVKFSGMIVPVSSLQGLGAFFGRIYPTTHFLTMSRGIFSKALTFADLRWTFVPMLIAVPVLIALGVLFLKKQET